VQGHAVAPDGRPAFDDDQRAAGDDGQRGQGLGGGDGGGDGDDAIRLAYLSEESDASCIFFRKSKSIHKACNNLFYKMRHSPFSL